MKNAYATVRRAVYDCPFALKAVSDKKLLKVAESYLPYSTGIEIETPFKDNQIKKTPEFKEDFRRLLSMPGIYSSEKTLLTEHYENKVRLNSGVNGMLALYELCEYMKKYFIFNTSSGIHFHIDCSEIKNFTSFVNYTIGQRWILDSLDSWKYEEKYNCRAISSMKGNWVTIRQDFKTIEFRICDMSFDYDYLIKRIIHCQNIVKKVKKDFLASEETKAGRKLP